MLLNYYSNLQGFTTRTLSKTIILPKKPLTIGSKVKVANVRKSNSLGIIVAYREDSVASKNTKGKPLNWIVQMQDGKDILHLNSSSILKVLQ